MYRVFAVISLLSLVAAAPRGGPDRIESRTVRLTQTVTLNDVPLGANQVRMWVPIPSDTTWQRVLDRQVVSAPGLWRLERQDQGRGDFIYVELMQPKSSTVSVEVACTVERRGVHFALGETPATSPIDPRLFKSSLDTDAPLMQADDRIKALADKAVGQEKDPGKIALALMQAVAEVADHYSKDPSKPVCGRGSSSDCMDQGGGCCTDLHSLFIAMARYRGLPARMQYGYRMLDAKAGKPYDPGYRCWVEFFIPRTGWVPTDIVAADNAEATNPARWASLSATRVWLWEGRSFELTPKSSAGRIDTMTCGFAEVDGKAVDPLPSPDGKIPSKLRRTVNFEVINSDRPEDLAKLPE